MGKIASIHSIDFWVVSKKIVMTCHTPLIQKCFQKEDSHFFIIQSKYEGALSLRCYKDFHVQEAAFIKQINNPRSRRKELYEDMTDDLFNDFMNEVIF